MIRKAECKVCGKAFQTGNRGAIAEFCQTCRAKAYHKRYDGRYYPKLALLINGSKCQRCGTTSKNLHVHHKDTDRANNTSDNLEVLCLRCHLKAHNIKALFPEPTKIREMRSQGFTFQEIGEHFGLSRQRIHRLFQKFILDTLPKEY